MMSAPASEDEVRGFLAAQHEAEAAPATAAVPTGFAQALGAVLDAATTAWPALRHDRVGFAAFLGRRIPSDVDPSAALAGRAVDDLYLAHGCLAGDPAALQAFDTAYLQGLTGLVMKQGFARDVVDETVQGLRLRLLTGERPALNGYSGIGGLRAWLRIIALRDAVRTQRDTQGPGASTDDDVIDALVDATADPALQYQRTLYQHEFRAAFQLAIDSLTVRERNLLRQHVVYHASIDDLGALYRVHRATASRWIQDARDRLAKETKRHLLTRLHLPATDYDSLLKLIHSQLQLSIERVLGDGERERDRDR